MSVTRRSFLNAASLVVVPRVWTASQASAAPAPTFPTQSPDLAREFVTVSHFNPERVRELLAQHQTLARAAWDWGFGDWETALGAASHVGHREIATLLLANGARPTIFSAAMLGQLGVVKAFVAASPGIESTPGPHGITLLRHAINGGPASQAVADYLQTLPGADRRPDTVPITPDQMATLTGEYVFGPGADESIAISIANNALTFARKGRAARGLTHVGDFAFFPAGAPLVRVRFTASTGGMTLIVHDPDRVLDARRTGGPSPGLR